MKNDNSNIRTLFRTFLKIGVFTFGGGYAMIALLETEFCVRKNWLDKKEFLDMTAISESTPGPTAVNSATFENSTGCRKAQPACRNYYTA